MSKYSLTWARIAYENNVLKILILLLGITTLVMGAATMRAVYRPPLLIERGCLSHSVTSSNAEPTEGEIEEFLKEALSQRFDSITLTGDGFLSLQAVQTRESEQAELSRRGIKQRILFNSLSRSGSQALVEADRILSVGPLRSAYAVKISVQFELTRRTRANPYGMILTQAQIIASPESGSNHGTENPTGVKDAK